ncbi:MAG: hypothetical protein R3B96_03665 [Pirellulaceae bacterium]
MPHRPTINVFAPDPHAQMGERLEVDHESYSQGFRGGHRLLDFLGLAGGSGSFQRVPLASD